MRRSSNLAAFVCVSAFAFVHSAQAATYTDTLYDNYYGGSAPSGYGDVVGNQDHFDIKKLVVTRINVSEGHSDLQVVVHTNYNPASSGALGTGFGSLFFGTDLDKVNLNATKSNYKSDTFSADTDRFNYVFDIKSHPKLDIPKKGGVNKATGTGSGTLYGLNGTGSDVQKSYDPKTGSTTHGNFRVGQAVDYKGSTTDPLNTGTWSFSAAADTLTFLISNENGLLGSEFLIAWAMTCANDVILGVVNIDLPPEPSSSGSGEAPLPAGFMLMASVLLGAGGIARWRQRRREQVA